MFLKCKKCDDLIYNVVIARKPEPNEPIILAVERSVEHDPIKHGVARLEEKNLEEKKRWLLAKDVILNHSDSAKALYIDLANLYIMLPQKDTF